MKYYVYEMGPVPKNLWFSIKDGNNSLGEYFDVIEETNTIGVDGGISYRLVK